VTRGAGRGVCSQVFVQPTGHVGLLGLSLPAYFLRDFLAWIGARARARPPPLLPVLTGHASSLLPY